MAHTARWLLRAHIVLCLAGVLCAVVGIVRYALIKEAFSNWVDGSGQSEFLKFGGRSDILLTIKTGLDLLLPLALILLARRAVRANDKEIMSSICLFECLCAGCSFLSALNIIYLLPWLFNQKSTAENMQCDRLSLHRPDDSLQESCEEGRLAFTRVASTAAVALTLQLFLGLCQMAAYAAGSIYAKLADDALGQGCVFTGLPLVNPNISASTIQPKNTVVGKVVMGVPIQAASGVGSPRASAAQSKTSPV
eukprot:TRINITY_DN66348_c0_g1_i1.p1 TRINITY_DN66348_c0_g1~~TRINITY_DN66348_c0_g1_i1.p1  ORF type:complete len:286 (+),score=42.61 TRINITY_DN66348_c0_g1_i1:107-859(+)